MDFKIDHFKNFNDDRGKLVVFLESSHLPKSSKKFGQIYFVTFKKKGVIRGNHYHKKWREWFGIIEGKLEVILKDIKTNEVKKFILKAESKKYTRLEIGPNIVHAFKSLTNYASLLNYANSEWNKNDDWQKKII